MSGTPGYIPIYGAYLAPQGTTPQVLLDGAPLSIVYQSDNQINVYYSYVSLGTHNLTVTTIYGTSNAVQFTALAGDATPSITTISPEEWEAGATTDFSIAGTGFGTNPGLTIDGGWIEAYGVYSAWDTGMNAWVRVSSNAPDETVTVSVTSNGYWGNSFMEQYPNQPRSGSKDAQVNGAPNQHNDYRPNWSITRQLLLDKMTCAYNQAGSMAAITSGYRNAASQMRINPDHPNGRHTRGDGVDIGETDDGRRLSFKQNWGPACQACVEPLAQTKIGSKVWVHMDWRGTCPQGW